jgi:hypothetical protein
VEHYSNYNIDYDISGSFKEVGKIMELALPH